MNLMQPVDLWFHSSPITGVLFWKTTFFKSAATIGGSANFQNYDKIQQNVRTKSLLFLCPEVQASTFQRALFKEQW